ncbi:UDP-N-acetylmuramoyl-L-alanine--D-glutamate ligase [Coraliomargarita algicola]|uniref:UDP-N-acetylmuramoylalanine--D-glutamate ligase n=1 Tax=Coraliomargarita algicola TaxID=3092156 RepID=A0ABZ0RFD8_9BACT|nr:UDP-N-acetylmuramoyl-L-alanine--D-glutamate ligase [Coraliomargarita sp. J2-16]WPJ94889.1 UDP-N-acetylmuramoyl-L-alanine--D-glutamate ligase [Coraliomargarita sp. J2-16]
MFRRCAIFGAGQSALAARRLANHHDLETVLIDEAGQGDRATFGADDLAEFDAFVFSPGFAQEHPWRVLAEASGRPCLSELAFAARYWQGKVIGVTGTNGKTTLTGLIDAALKVAGEVSVAAGNIGYTFSDAVLSSANQPGAYVVLEISSFQAELADGLQLDALLWTNFAEDHLDRYGSMIQYFNAKALLFDCLKKNGICVVGKQVAQTMESMRKVYDACCVADEDSALLFKLDRASVFHRYPNSENFSLAAEMWWLLGKSSAQLIEAANAFTLAPHRLAMVAEYDGVYYWDDSKATNFHATLAGLESVGPPVVWIGGGRAKGGDVEAFAHELSNYVNAAVVYGEVAERLAQALQGSLDSVHVHPCFADAVYAAVELAKGIPEANVLLSPGFSSFDQFSSYADRGKSFTDMVLSLKNTRNAS